MILSLGYIFVDRDCNCTNNLTLNFDSGFIFFNVILHLLKMSLEVYRTQLSAYRKKIECVVRHINSYVLQ